jgi:hypothetical protein
MDPVILRLDEKSASGLNSEQINEALVVLKVQPISKKNQHFIVAVAHDLYTTLKLNNPRPKKLW